MTFKYFMSLFKKMASSYKTIVLSGSSTNGCVTLGAVQYMYMKGLLTDLVNLVGCSSGSIICAVLSLDLSPLEGLEYIFNENTFKSFGKFNFTTFLTEGKGLLSFENIKLTLQSIYEQKLGYVPTLKQLYKEHNKNMIISTVNFSKGEQVYLQWKTHPSLLVTDAIQMSCSFPLLYKPFEYDGDLYIDGGVGDNFPISLIRELKLSSKTIGICVIEKVNYKDNNQDLGILAAIQTLHKIYLTHKKITLKLMNTFKENDGLWIYLDDIDSSFFDFSKTRFGLAQMFLLGYDRMTKIL